MPSSTRARTLSALLAAATLAAGTAVAQEREYLDVDIFARVGQPGQPEGIAIGPDGTVYVGTHATASGMSDQPSKVFAYAPDGRLLTEYVIQGQHLEETHGIVGMAFDGDGLLHILDRAPPRVLTLDPLTGAQADYASFRDVPSCSLGGTPGDCSAGVLDLGEFPDYPVFAADGTMYVTDLEQALIWRVPPGGGEAQVWFTDERLEGVFGPNGIQFLADGRTLLFAQTGSQPPGTPDPGTGVIYTLPVEDDGSPGELQVFWEGQPVDGPDGFAIAASGNVYVALAGANQVLVLSPAGEELARIPATPADNQMQEVPFDNPASAAFLGERLLVTNQSFFAGNEASWVVFDIFAGETGLPLFRPRLGGKVTGGGKIPGAAGGRAHFSFVAKSGSGGSPVFGMITYRDQDADVEIRGARFDRLTVDGNSAVFTGAAEVNGATERIRVTVEDHGEPSTADRFGIEVLAPEGYSNGPELLDGGNIQVH